MNLILNIKSWSAYNHSEVFSEDTKFWLNLEHITITITISIYIYKDTSFPVWRSNLQLHTMLKSRQLNVLQNWLAVALMVPKCIASPSCINGQYWFCHFRQLIVFKAKFASPMLWSKNPALKSVLCAFIALQDAN